jgi:hypothetical protein
MPTNIDPIFTGTAVSPFGAAVTAANTAADGTGTVTTIFTADATNGGFVGLIKLKPLGTNVASVARFFVNNGSTNATATNNVLIGEITLPATTVSQTAALIELGYLVNQGIQSGYKINMTIGTAVAAGWIASVDAGSYTKG